LLFLFLYYYIYFINHPNYRAPYSYTGITTGYYLNDDYKDYKVEKNDCVKHMAVAFPKVLCTK